MKCRLFGHQPREEDRGGHTVFEYTPCRRCGELFWWRNLPVLNKPPWWWRFRLAWRALVKGR
jgi:hypothetical protein